MTSAIGSDDFPMPECTKVRIRERLAELRGAVAAWKDTQQADSGRDGNSRSARVGLLRVSGARSQPTWKERVGDAVAPAGIEPGLPHHQALPAATE